MPAARGVLEHRVHLRAGNPGKPGQELLDRRAALEVLEQGAHGYPRAAEYPGAAELRGIAFYRRDRPEYASFMAGTPIPGQDAIPAELLQDVAVLIGRGLTGA